MTDQQLLKLATVFKARDNIDIYLAWEDGREGLRRLWIEEELERLYDTEQWGQRLD
jgi:hypothetical protein